MKKFISFTLTIALVLSCFGVAFASEMIIDGDNDVASQNKVNLNSYADDNV